MGFTDKFIKVPIKRFSSKEEQLTGKVNLVETYLKFLPFDIAHYGPTWNDDQTEFSITQVCFKSGQSFAVYLSIDQFENILNKHQSEPWTTPR